MAIEPTSDQISALVGLDHEGEIVMLNLIRFRDRSTVADESGAETYMRYGATVQQHLDGVGGRILWAGSPRTVVVGDADAHRWDMVALVSYPSKDAFLTMSTSEAYVDGGPNELRQGGTEELVLVACAPSSLG